MLPLNFTYSEKKKTNLNPKIPIEKSPTTSQLSIKITPKPKHQKTSQQLKPNTNTDKVLTAQL